MIYPPTGIFGLYSGRPKRCFGAALCRYGARAPHPVLSRAGQRSGLDVRRSSSALVFFKDGTRPLGFAAMPTVAIAACDVTAEQTTYPDETMLKRDLIAVIEGMKFNRRGEPLQVISLDREAAS